MPNYKKPMMKKGMTYKMGSTKEKMMEGEDTLPTMKKGTIAYKYDSAVKMNKYDKDMMHERELIYDAKKEIHKEDLAKKKHMHVVHRVASSRSRG